MYELIFSKEAVKFILSLDKGYKRKMKEIAEALKENPFSYPYTKIKEAGSIKGKFIGVQKASSKKLQQGTLPISF